MSNKNRVPHPTCRGGYQPANPAPTRPPSSGSCAQFPAAAKVLPPAGEDAPEGQMRENNPLTTDYLLQALSEQMEANTKLVKIVIDLTHRLEQATTIIEGLNHTIISFAKEDTT